MEAKIKMEAVPTYEAVVDETRYQVQFRKVTNTPGFSHRVIIDRLAVDWLKDTHNPSKSTASYFLDKQIRKNEEHLQELGI